MAPADGGDFLSFARVGLPASTYLDPGSLGCIGVGTPFGMAASLAYPDRRVVVATGDGAFGFNAMELDSAVRHRAGLLVVAANNGSWAIEVRDQQETHGQVVGTRLQFADNMYDLRAVIEGLACRKAAEINAQKASSKGPSLIRAGRKAVASGSVSAMIAADMAFHAFIYALSENPLVARSMETHWTSARAIHLAPPARQWLRGRDQTRCRSGLPEDVARVRRLVCD